MAFFFNEIPMEFIYKYHTVIYKKNTTSNKIHTGSSNTTKQELQTEIKELNKCKQITINHVSRNSTLCFDDNVSSIVCNSYKLIFAIKTNHIAIFPKIVMNISAYTHPLVDMPPREHVSSSGLFRDIDTEF